MEQSPPAFMPPAQSAQPQKAIRYGRRVLLATLVAYLSLIAFLLTPFILLLPIFNNTGLVALWYMAIYGVFTATLALVAGIAMIILDIRYLAKGKLSGKTFMATRISLIIYLLLVAWWVFGGIIGAMV